MTLILFVRFPNRTLRISVLDVDQGDGILMEMPDGSIITGKTSTLLGASSALILNALKVLAGIDDSAKLISPQVIEPIMELKVNYLGNHNPLLHIDEILIALSVEANTNPEAKAAYKSLIEASGKYRQNNKNLFNRMSAPAAQLNNTV